VTFAAGSAALSPDMERQTVRVADFLRRSPYVTLSLTSITSPGDEEALKERAVAARLDKFQKEQGVADQAAALRRYYQVAVKDALLPRTVEEQLLLLRRREPVPSAALADLKRERLQVTRDRLANVEGIPAKRLLEAPEGGAPAPGTAASSPPPASAPPSSAPSSSAAPAPAPPAAPPSASAPPAGAPGASPPEAAAPGATAAAAPGAGGRVEFGIGAEPD
jgi:hypothetical protein